MCQFLSSAPLLISATLNNDLSESIAVKSCRTELHFVRCIKPNAGQKPADFEAPMALQQLRCCGVLEVTRIARAGYPTRYLHRQFAQRYHALLHGAHSRAFLF